MLSDEPVINLQSMQMVPFSSVMSLFQPIRTAASPTLLSLLLNGRTFFNLSDIIDHIHDYPVGLERVKFYCDVIEQMAAIFEIRSFFASNLMKVIKKDKSWQNKEWTSVDIAQLFAPLARNDKIVQTGRNCREKTLKTLNKHWGPAITGFFRACYKNKKTLRQLVHLASGSCCYSDARRLVNTRVVKTILSGHSTHLTRYKTRTNDWLTLEANSGPNISFPCLAAANVYYGLFGELLEKLLLSLLYGFSGPCHYGPYGQLLLVELNLSALQAAQGQDSGNGADSNQGLYFGDEVNVAAPDGVNTGAGNGADVTKRPDCGNGVVA